MCLPLDPTFSLPVPPMCWSRPGGAWRESVLRESQPGFNQETRRRGWGRTLLIGRKKAEKPFQNDPPWPRRSESAAGDVHRRGRTARPNCPGLQRLEEHKVRENNHLGSLLRSRGSPCRQQQRRYWLTRPVGGGSSSGSPITPEPRGRR